LVFAGSGRLIPDGDDFSGVVAAGGGSVVAGGACLGDAAVCLGAVVCFAGTVFGFVVVLAVSPARRRRRTKAAAAPVIARPAAETGTRGTPPSESAIGAVAVSLSGGCSRFASSS